MWLVLMGSWAVVTQCSNTSIDVYVISLNRSTLVDKVEERMLGHQRVIFSRARERTFHVHKDRE